MVRVEASSNMQLAPVHKALLRLAGLQVLGNFRGVTRKVLEEISDKAVSCLLSCQQS
jgi:hypothetical protein